MRLGLMADTVDSLDQYLPGWWPNNAGAEVSDASRARYATCWPSARGHGGTVAFRFLLPLSLHARDKGIGTRPRNDGFG